MTTTTLDQTTQPPVVSREEWLAARLELLRQEKALTRQRDKLAAERGKLPWVKVDKNYVFDGPNGPETLAGLFAGRSQLIVYHFMFGPGWEEGCVGCSFLSDHLDGTLPHLENHDVSLVVVSRAPAAEFQPFQKRMGWKFKWLSSAGSDFNYDYHVSFTEEEMARGKSIYNFAESDIPVEELSGISVFARNEQGEIFHTYSSYARGCDNLLTTYHLLEMTPKGRNEHGPRQSLADWVRHHDRYGANGHVASTGRYQPEEDQEGSCCHGGEKS